MFQEDRLKQDLQLGQTGGAIVPYNPQELAQRAYDSLPHQRQTRANLNALMQRADEGPEIIEATILEDKDLSRNGQLIHYIKEMKINVTHNHYYGTQSRDFGYQPVSLGYGHPPAFNPPAVGQPFYFEPPQITFNPTVDVRPVIHVHVDPSIHNSAHSSSRSSGGDGENWNLPAFIFIVFCGFCMFAIGLGGQE